ncbi:MAG: ComEC/Rec2 family competence protein [Christensenellales bacterium]|jgi:ComEC/Rec2-related protein
MASPVRPSFPAAFSAAFGQRPLFSAGLAWGLGMLAGLTLGYPGLIPVCLLAGGIIWLCREKRRLAVLCGLLAAFSCLYAALSLPSWRNTEKEILPGAPVTGVVEGVVLPGSRQILLGSLTVNGEPQEGRLQLWLPAENAALQKGALLSAELSLRPAETESLFGCYTLSRGIRYTAAAYRYDVVPGPALWGMDAFRVRLAAALDKDLSPSSAAVMKALLLGDGSQPDEDHRLYREMGGAHLLAVSGLHVSIILMLLAWVPAAMWKIKFIWAVPFIFLSNGLLLLLFGLLTAFRLSVMRAIWMWLFAWLLKGLAKPPDPPLTLVLSFGAITALQPLHGLDPGLWLSMLAVLGILSVLPLSRQLPVRQPFLQNRLRDLLAGVAALLFVLPLTAAMFGLVQPLTPVTTLLLTPPLIAVVFIGVLYTLGIFGFPWLARVLASPLDALLRLMARGMSILTKWVHTVPLTLNRPWPAIAALCLTPLWSPGFLRPRRWVRFSAMGLAALLTALAFLPVPREVTGDHLLLTPVWNHTALVFAGDDMLYAVTDTGGDPLVTALQKEAAGNPVTLLYLGEDMGDLAELQEALADRTRLAAVYLPGDPKAPPPPGCGILPEEGLTAGGFSLSLRRYCRSAGTKLYTAAVIDWKGQRLVYGELFRLKTGDTSFADCFLYIHSCTTSGRLRGAGDFPGTLQVWNGSGTVNLAETGPLLLQWDKTGIRWYKR